MVRKFKGLVVFTRIVMALPFVGLSPGLSFASGGVGTRGGAETIEIAGYPRLRDLVEKTNCNWVSGSQARARAPGFSGIVAKIRPASAYLASLYERELSALTFCFVKTGLPALPKSESAVVGALKSGTRQLAIRLNDAVYIDENQFNRLPAEDRDYVFFHEVTHSFIRLGTVERMLKLRSFVRFIHDSATIDAESLSLQMRGDEVAVPEMDEATWNQYASFFAANSISEKREYVRAWLNGLRGSDFEIEWSVIGCPRLAIPSRYTYEALTFRRFQAIVVRGGAGRPPASRPGDAPCFWPPA